jgi:SAM-dependent methyltransferase
MNTIEDLQCPLCRSLSCVKEMPYRGQHVIFQGLALYRCSECAIVFASPPPTEDELTVYNSDFFSASGSGIPTNAETLLFFRGVAQLRLQYIESGLCGAPMPSSVLEIGPGPGYFCTQYLNQTPRARYAAVETDLSCHDSLKELGVDVHESFEALADTGKHFDLVVISHVLEHCAQPRDFLERALSFLVPGGILFAEVPCRDYEYKDIFEAHLLFFDKEPMRCLMNELGLDIIKLSYHGESIGKMQRKDRLIYK